MVVGQVGVVAVVGVVTVAVMVAGVTSYPSTTSINLSISDIFMHTSKQG